jgi:hypothetical protein
MLVIMALAWCFQLSWDGGKKEKFPRMILKWHWWILSFLLYIGEFWRVFAAFHISGSERWTQERFRLRLKGDENDEKLLANELMLESALWSFCNEFKKSKLLRNFDKLLKAIYFFFQEKKFVEAFNSLTN